MSNKIYDTDFSKFLPNVLKKDESMMAIAKVVTEKLLEISNSIDKVLIYANIDKLPGEILDILAYDMHVDWYDETYPVEAKREVIKSSVIVHKKMGTKYAVEKALRAVHPASCIEEWFEYGGNPYCFRIICDTTESKVQANYEEIVNTVNIYKRLSAHLDSVTYQAHATMLITTETGWYIYRTPLTGKTITGTKPQRNIKGKEIKAKYTVKTSRANYKYKSRQAGTYPQRNIIFKNAEETTRITIEKNKVKYKVPGTGRTKTGTHPQRNLIFKNQNEKIQVKAEMKKTKFKTPMTGKTTTGTEPERNRVGREREKEMAAKTSVENYSYNTKMCGSNKKL